MSALILHLEYYTNATERLSFFYQTSEGVEGRLDLQTSDLANWRGEMEVPAGTLWIEGAYRVVRNDGDGIVRQEDESTRRFYIEKRSRIEVFDSWTEKGIPSVFRHAAFSKCVFGQHRGTLCKGLRHDQHLLLVSALPSPKGFRWGVLGNTKSLGGWQPEKAVALERTNTYEWACPLKTSDFSSKLEYKIVLIDENSAGHVLWERGENRTLPVGPTTVKNTSAFVFASSPRFDLPMWRGAGIVVPVFSLRSQTSFGIGDFGDLRKLVDWASSVGMSAIQILPINDTTRNGQWGDSYPYSAISVFALHPLYIDLEEWKDTDVYQKYRAQGDELNDLPELEYERVFKLKMEILRELFRVEGRKVLASEAYKEFTAQNRSWLDPYARFCQLRDEQGTANFREWKLRNNLKARPTVGPGFYSFLQFLLYRQLTAVREHAEQCGILLKGDIPIGIARDSVPAWKDEKYFHFDGSAGAPPDAFAANGQNWGFPTYNWEEMEKNGFRWWKKRIRNMSKFFHAYRIDHVLGFFRIWTIPINQIYGTLGYFRPALPMSGDEIAHYGFNQPVFLYTRPHVSNRDMSQMAEHLNVHELMNFFQKEGGYYTLKPEASTQRKIVRLTADDNLRQCLLDVCADVLFIEDPEKKGFYHPRISAQYTQAYRNLPPDQQAAFNRLYDDFFYRRHNQFWAEGAVKKLSALISAAPDSEDHEELRTLLPCAEDLGMVPDGVKEVLQRLSILSLEIQTMPKDPKRRFGLLADVPYMAVDTIATHDMPPLRLWWKQNPGDAQAFWNEVLWRPGAAPAEADPATCEQILRNHLGSPAMLSLHAFQDWTAIDGSVANPNPDMEQINIPADPNHHWRYRMHITLEDLFAATNFNEHVRMLIRNSGR